jgi:hypothetical protein
MVKSIELIKMQGTLQRATDSRQQLLVSRILTPEVYFQDGLVVGALGLHLRPPRGIRSWPAQDRFALALLVLQDVSNGLHEKYKVLMNGK